MKKTYSVVEKLQVLRKIIAYELSKDEKGFFVYLTTYSRFKPIAEIHLYKDIEKPLDILNAHIDNDGIDERDVKAYFREHFENQLSYLKDKEMLKVIK